MIFGSSQNKKPAIVNLRGRTWIILLMGSLLTGLLSALLLSHRSSQASLAKIRTREVSLLMSAIEAGPARFAQLHSSSITQDILNGFMSNVTLRKRGIVGIRIESAGQDRFAYATWKSPHFSNAADIETISRIIDDGSSLNPVKSSITFDRTFPLEEASEFRRLWFATTLFSVVFIVGIVAVSCWPVFRSIQNARALVAEPDSSKREKLVDKIRFLPVKELALLAERVKELEKQKQIQQIAEQVFHDIRSPLSALSAIISGNEISSKEEVELGRRAIQRIVDIASDLSFGESQPRKEPVSLLSVARGTIVDPVSIPIQLNYLVLEKTKEWQAKVPHANIVLTCLDWDSFVGVCRDAFDRAISNIVNNAFEASASNIRIEVSTDPGNVIVSVRDDGAGIPKSEIVKVLERGGTYAKEGGSGLGLSYAVSVMKECGGDLQILSTFNEGTNVKLKFIRESAPSWYCAKIEPARGSHVKVINTDTGELESWREPLRRISLAHAGSIQIDLLDGLERAFDHLEQLRVSRNGSPEIYIMTSRMISQQPEAIALLHRIPHFADKIAIIDFNTEETLLQRLVSAGFRILPHSMFIQWLGRSNA